MLDRRLSLHLKFSVFIEQLTIHQNFTILTHIANKIPMNGGLVMAARFRVAGAYRHVDCAANFFVKENAFGEAFYTVICANGKFAQIARAFIQV